MILSHKHKSIFLKTKKTAGTSIELGLTAFCADSAVITPLAQSDEVLRAGQRGAQNWRRHGWWQSSRSFWKRRMFKVAAEDDGFYNHTTAAAAKALINDDDVWRSYFKFAFDRNPWDRQVSYYHYCFRNQTTQAPFDRFVQSDRRARLNNHDIYAIDGEVAVDFVGRYETLKEDLKHALAQAASMQIPNSREPREVSGRTSAPIGNTTRRNRGGSAANGTGPRSRCSGMSSEPA